MTDVLASITDPAEARIDRTENAVGVGQGDDGGARPAALAGVLGGLIGATCCVGPALGVAIGAGSGSFLLALSDYRLQAFAIGGFVAFAVAAVIFVRRRRACPTDAERRALRSRWLDAAILAFGLTYVLGRFLVPRIIDLVT